MKNLSSIIKDYNYNFIKTTVQRIIKISLICAAVFLCQNVLLSFFLPIDTTSTIIFALFTLSLGIAFYISRKSFKYSYEISTVLLFISDFIFINSLIIFGPLGIMGIYNPSINFIFMMFIAFTVFTPNVTSAVLHSFAYALSAIFYYVYNFNQAKLVLNNEWYKITNASLFGYPLAYLMTATIVSLYVWYRSDKHAKLRSIIYKNLITSVHEKLISPESFEYHGWTFLTAIVNIQDDFFGGDFISVYNAKNRTIIFMGDVMDHGLDTSQISFGLMSVFYSNPEQAPDQILINCHSFLRTIGSDLGGLSYICVVEFFIDGTCKIYGSTGINPQLISGSGIYDIKTDNIVFGSPHLVIKKIKPKVLKLKSSTLVLKTDGWNSEFDEKGSVIASYS